MHAALKIDPETPDADRPGPVSTRLIAAARQHSKHLLAAEEANRAATKIQAAYRGRVARSMLSKPKATALALKAKAAEGLKSTLEPYLLKNEFLVENGITWCDLKSIFRPVLGLFPPSKWTSRRDKAVAILTAVTGGALILKSLVGLNPETVVAKIVVAVVMSGLRPGACFSVHFCSIENGESPPFFWIC